jgi:hypothetical protein
VSTKLQLIINNNKNSKANLRLEVENKAIINIPVEQLTINRLESSMRGVDIQRGHLH